MTLGGVKQESQTGIRRRWWLWGKWKTIPSGDERKKELGEYLPEMVPYPSVMVQESENCSDLFLYWKMSFCSTRNVCSNCCPRDHQHRASEEGQPSGTEHSFWGWLVVVKQVSSRTHALQMHRGCAQTELPGAASAVPTAEPQNCKWPSCTVLSQWKNFFVQYKQVKVIRLCSFIRHLFLLTERNKTKKRVNEKNVSFHWPPLHCSSINLH